ncbi:MAG TPA: hypothetical protein VFN25_09170 [Dokdonella sp.]|uniref:hypothetical protein n=1 Tax=Dokdonella sp. TaxID=2291710 RepID=UPI002D80D3CF|nr:hypothetical protein [Dokdonella sp.]HET9033063.1 hypothetical protein [Dokdonella sp.]
MLQRSMTHGLLAAAAVLLLSMGSARGDVALVQVGMAPALVSTRALLYDIEGADFPAISADRKEVAVLHHSGDSFTAIAVDILSVATSKRLKRFVLLTENQGGKQTSDAAREVLWDKLTAPNRYLAAKRFVSMTPLYSIEWRDNPPQAKDLLPSFAQVRYDLQTGEVTIIAAADGKILLRMRRPVIDRSGTDPDAPKSFSQQVPEAGWLDEQSQNVLLLLQTMTRDESTYPVEWLVVNLDKAK